MRHLIFLIINIILLTVLIIAHTRAKTPEEKEKANKLAYITLIITLSASILSSGFQLFEKRKEY